MRKLAIAYGNSRQAKKWVNKEIVNSQINPSNILKLKSPHISEFGYTFSNSASNKSMNHHITQAISLTNSGKEKAARKT